MAQLVKLYDYISRYESDVFHYPSSFIRMKKKQWEQLKTLWEEGYWPTKDGVISQKEEETKVREGFLKRLIPFPFGKKKDQVEEDELGDRLVFPIVDYSFDHKEMPIPDTLEELKIHFLNEIFRVQIHWASSTLREKSFVDSSFLRDENLKYFLQRFPDTYLFFYMPIFLLKKAPVECETFFITPNEIFTISFLEEEEDAVYIGSDGRFWEIRTTEGSKNILNPSIALQRTETIIKQLLKNDSVDLPVSKIILSRNGYIDYPASPFGLHIIDKKNYHEWFMAMRSLRAPIKHHQLKAAKALLAKCKTDAVKRFDSF